MWYAGSKWNLHTICWDAVGCEWGTISVYFRITYVCFIPSRLPVFAVSPSTNIKIFYFCQKCHLKDTYKIFKKFHVGCKFEWDFSVLPKVFWAPVLRTSGSWNLPVQMEGSLVRNFNNYYVLLIPVFDGCSNRFDPCDHFDLVCCCLSPVLISDKRSCWKISQSLKPIWLDVEILVPLFLKNQSVLQRCLSNFRANGRLKEAQRKIVTGLLMWYWISPKTCSVFSKLKSDSLR